MRLGLFGGTFDPPHVGHLLAASDAFEALALDRVVFIPNAAQPLKAGAGAAPAPDRLAMVQLLCHGDVRFSVDPVEVERGGLSFTIDTLRDYRAREPNAALFLLLGEDAAAGLPSWRDPAGVQSLAEVVVLRRTGGAASGPRMENSVATRFVDVSSTEIRARVAAGLSLRGFVPDSVAAYIASHGLYRA